MLKLMIAASALAFVPTVAAHANPPSGDPPGCAVGQGGDVDNDPTGNGCPGQGGQGGNGGNGGNGGGGGQGGGGGDGGHSDVDVSVAVANANTNQQQQGQLQGQLQGQQQSIGDTTATGGNAASSATGGSVTGSGNSSSSSTAAGGAGGNASVASSGNSQNDNSNSSTVTVEGDTTTIKGRRIPVATAYAAPLTSGNDVCMGSVSAGAQGAVIGLSFAKTYTDEHCVNLKLARELKNQGFGVEACHLMIATEARVAEAFRRSGRSCENATMVVNVVEPTPPAPVAQPAYAPSPVQPPFTGERGK